MGLARLILGMLLVVSLTAADVPAMKAGTHGYGNDRRQRLDLYRRRGGPAAPVILFIHGGGWSAGSKDAGEGVQPAYFTRQDYAWAAMNYRLVPHVTVEEQAGDVARAIGWLVRRAGRLGIDARHIILVGHSSGAQLAALVATDPQWLKQAGVPFGTIAGVVALDGAGIDVPGIMAAGAGRSPFYANAFGPDVERQARLSPLTHVGAPDAPYWLFLYDGANNPAAGFFANRFADAMNAHGGRARVVPIFGTTHMKLLNGLGTAGDPATLELDAFLSGLRTREARQ